jgi:hypothetical protein
MPMLNKVIIGTMLAAAVVIWLFAPGEMAGIIIVLGIAAFAVGAGLKKKRMQSIRKTEGFR